MSRYIEIGEADDCPYRQHGYECYHTQGPEYCKASCFPVGCPLPKAIEEDKDAEIS